MTNQEDHLVNKKREDFKTYLIDSITGVIDALTKVFADLYSMVIRPLDYIRTHMTEMNEETEELKILKATYDTLVSQSQENMKLAKEIKELELELKRKKLSKSKIEETDEINIGTE